MTAKHTCALCGKRSTVDRMVFSRHTRLRYCRDLDACRARAAKRKKVTA